MDQAPILRWRPNSPERARPKATKLSCSENPTPERARPKATKLYNSHILETLNPISTPSNQEAAEASEASTQERRARWRCAPSSPVPPGGSPVPASVRPSRPSFPRHRQWALPPSSPPSARPSRPSCPRPRRRAVPPSPPASARPSWPSCPRHRRRALPLSSPASARPSRPSYPRHRRWALPPSSSESARPSWQSYPRHRRLALPPSSMASAWPSAYPRHRRWALPPSLTASAQACLLRSLPRLLQLFRGGSSRSLPGACLPAPPPGYESPVSHLLSNAMWSIMGGQFTP